MTIACKCRSRNVQPQSRDIRCRHGGCDAGISPCNGWSGAPGAAESDVAEVSSRVEDCFRSRFFVAGVDVKGKETRIV